MPLTDRQRKFLETLYKISAENNSKVVIEEDNTRLHKYHFEHPSFGRCYAFIDEDGELKIKKGSGAVELLNEADPVFAAVMTRGESFISELVDLPAISTFFPAAGSYNVSPKSSEVESRVKRNTGLSRNFVGAVGGIGPAVLGRNNDFKVIQFFLYKGREYNSFTLDQEGNIKSLSYFSDGSPVNSGPFEVTPEIEEKFREGLRVLKLRKELENVDDVFAAVTASIELGLTKSLTLSNGVTIIGIAEKKYTETSWGMTSELNEIVFVDSAGNKVRLETLAAFMSDEQVDALIASVRTSIDRKTPLPAFTAAARTSAAVRPSAPTRSTSTAAPRPPAPIATHELVLRHVRGQFTAGKKVALMPAGASNVGFYTAADFSTRAFTDGASDDVVVLFGGNDGHVNNPEVKQGGGQAEAASRFANPDSVGAFAFPITTQGPDDLFRDFASPGSLGRRMMAAEIAVLKKAIDAGAKIVIPTGNDGTPSMPGELSHKVFVGGTSPSRRAAREMIASLADHPAPAAATNAVDAVGYLRNFVKIRANFVTKYGVEAFCNVIETSIASNRQIHLTWLSSALEAEDRKRSSAHSTSAVPAVPATTPPATSASSAVPGLSIKPPPPKVPKPRPPSEPAASLDASRGSATSPAVPAGDQLILHRLVAQIKERTSGAGNILSVADQESLVNAFRDNQALISVVGDGDKTPLDLLAEFAATLPNAATQSSPLITAIFDTRSGISVLSLRAAFARRSQGKTLPLNSAARKIQFQIEDGYKALLGEQKRELKDEFERLATEAGVAFNAQKFTAILEVYPKFGVELLVKAFEDGTLIKLEALEVFRSRGIKVTEELLHYASNGDNDEILKIVTSDLAEFADFNAYSRDELYLHNTTLHLLAAKNWGNQSSPPANLALRETSAQIAARLIAAGADPNLQNTKGHTPLDIAIARRDMDMVQAICNSGKVTEATIRKALQTFDKTPNRLSATKLVTTECLIIAELAGKATPEAIEADLDFKDQCLPFVAADFDGLSGDEKKDQLKAVLNAKLAELSDAASRPSTSMPPRPAAPTPPPPAGAGVSISVSSASSKTPRSALGAPASGSTSTTSMGAPAVPSPTGGASASASTTAPSSRAARSGVEKGARVMRAPEAGEFKGFIADFAERRVLIDPIASQFVAKEVRDLANPHGRANVGRQAALRKGFKVVSKVAVGGKLTRADQIRFIAPDQSPATGEAVVFEESEEGIGGSDARKGINDYIEGIQIFYDETQITPEEIHDIMLIKAGKDPAHRPSGTTQKDYADRLTSLSPYVLYRFESRQMFEMDSSGIMVLPADHKKAQSRPFYYNHLPSLQTYAPDWYTFTNQGVKEIDTPQGKRTVGDAAITDQDGLRNKYKAAIKLQLLAAASNDEGCFILEPNAFLRGLNDANQKIARELYLQAAIAAVTEFQNTQPALAARLGKVFLQSSVATAAPTGITEIDFTITSGMDAAYPHVSRGDGDKAVAQPVMGDALGPVGNYALSKYGERAAEENLCRQMPMMLCVMAPQNNERLQDRDFLISHSRTLRSVSAEVSASAATLSGSAVGTAASTPTPPPPAGGVSVSTATPSASAKASAAGVSASAATPSASAKAAAAGVSISPPPPSTSAKASAAGVSTSAATPSASAKAAAVGVSASAATLSGTAASTPTLPPLATGAGSVSSSTLTPPPSPAAGASASAATVSSPPSVALSTGVSASAATLSGSAAGTAASTPTLPSPAGGVSVSAATTTVSSPPSVALSTGVSASTPTLPSPAAGASASAATVSSPPSVAVSTGVSASAATPSKSAKAAGARGSTSASAKKSTTSDSTWKQEAGDHEIPRSSVEAIMYMPLVSGKVHVVKKEVKNVLDADKVRGGKFRVIDDVYPNDSSQNRQEAIEKMFLNIIAVAADEFGLNAQEVLDAIALTKKQGGIAHRKEAGKKFEEVDFFNQKLANFSGRFQTLAADCGIYTGRSSANNPVGCRLLYLPEEVIKRLGDDTAVLRDVKQSTKEIEEIKATIQGVKNINTIPKVHGGRS